MELNERKLRILRAIIDDYIATAAPVGSRTLTKKYISELSAATIRNEMSDLEEMGYLESPHTSAGRIPSYKAYRYYVDRLIAAEAGELNREEREAINTYFSGRLEEMQTVIKNAARVVSNLTDYTSVAITPQMENSILRRIQLVPVTSGAALVVIVTDTAILKDAIVRVPAEITPVELSGISEALSKRFESRPLRELSRYAFDDMPGEFAHERQFFRQLTGALEKAAGAEPGSIVVDGALNIFHHPEFKEDVGRAQSFLMALSAQDDSLYKMLSQATQWEFTIRIGPENTYAPLKDMSVVTATYKIGDQPLGSVGVIGPTRMDYQRVLRILNHMGKSVGEILSNMIDDGS